MGEREGTGRRMTRILLGCMAIGALVIGIPTAKADPEDDFVHDAALICRALDRDDSPQGVAAIIQKGLDQGVPYDTMVQTTAYALMYVCPEHKAAFERAADYYGKKTLA